MAPPHTSKKASTTVSQTSSRRGGRQLRKRIVEQLEEESDTGYDEVDDMDVDEADAAEPEDSQNASDSKLQQLMVDMVDAQRKRHQFRKQSVYKAYTKSHADAQEAIASLFDDHETKASQAYDSQLSRLQDLLKEKARIESAMSEKVAKLRSDYLAQSHVLQRVIEYRIKELR